ncbi:MAG: hypothetical protein ACRDPR_13410, partial [Nocardioidaceae bacterium]
GNRVAFESFATNLATDDTNATADVFVHDRTTHETTLVSVDGAGRPGDGASVQPSLAADGRYVAFASAAGNLVGDDTSGRALPTPSNFAVFDAGGVPTYGTEILAVEGSRVTVRFPGGVAEAVGAMVPPRTLIDLQVVPVDVVDGRSNANPTGAVGGGPGAEPEPPVQIPAAGRSRSVRPTQATLLVAVTTGRPDLRAVYLGANDGAGFCFDEPVNDAGTPAAFQLQGYNSTVRINAWMSSVSSTDGTCVLAGFPPVVRDQLTVGVVEADAVVSESDVTNLAAALPTGRRSSGGISLVQGPGDVLPPPTFTGRTSGPDATVVRLDPSTPDTRATYEFDESLPSQTPEPADFGFFDQFGRITRATDAHQVGGSGIEVTFPAIDPDANPVRYFVEEGAVHDLDVTGAGYERNASQATGEATGAADLDGATVVASEPVAVFDLRFDRDVSDPDATRIAFYAEDGTRFQPEFAAVTGDRTLRVFVPAVTGFAAEMVFVTAEAGAVRNPIAGADEPSTTGTRSIGSYGFSPGRTDAPDLLSAEYDGEAVTVTYVFDERVRDVHLSPADPVLPNVPRDIFVRDLVTGRTIRASVTAAGAQVNGDSAAPSLSGNGRFVAFDSASAQLLPGDDPKVRDVFERDLLVAHFEPDLIDFGDGLTVGERSAGRSATLRNDGFGPLVVQSTALGGASPEDFRVTTDGCRRRVLQPLETCPVTVAFAPTLAGERRGDLVVTDDALGSPRVAALRGLAVAPPEPQVDEVPPPRYTPSITLDPNLGPTGTVTMVRGQGFPPATAVQLRWEPTAANPLGQVPLGRPVAVTTDAQGAFDRVPVLVFRRDVLGPRGLSASGTGADWSANAEFLAVPSTIQPAGKDIAQVVRRVQLLGRKG